jgi:hypothetical protein
LEGTLFTVVPLVSFSVGFFFVALVASIVPVEGRKLPAVLRAARFVFRNERDPNYAGLATSVVAQKWSIRAYRLALGAYCVFGVVAMLGGSTNARLVSSLGSEPLVVTVVALLALVMWALYVIVEFRRASPSR